jgi:hypothetical protein
MPAEVTPTSLKVQPVIHLKGFREGTFENFGVYGRNGKREVVAPTGH